jgi:acetate kinase
VHGGPVYAEPVLLDDAVLARLKSFAPLAPLHQPYNLAGIEAAREAFPGAAQIACFDTAFHRRHTFIADTYALPRAYYDEGVRRYGFHGLSYEFIHRILRHEEPVLARGKVIVAHLGNGASLCAINAGKSVGSTMGFTALDGLPMGTRCGQLDPGVVLYLMAEKKMSAEQITDLLYKNSGLKGMSGISNDVRELEVSGEQSARDALDYFVSRVRRNIGGLSAELGGLDCLVLTGGIGENAVEIRRKILENMEWFGIQIDFDANARNERIISEKGSPTVVLILKTDEERMIAAHTAELLDLKKPLVPPLD